MMPAVLCDMTGMSMMYFGLTLTSPSSFEILKGAVIIFTGINSKLFLKRQMSWKKWGSLIIIMTGLLVVGMSDILPSVNHENQQIGTNAQSPISRASNDLALSKTSNETCSTDGNGLSNEILGDLLIVAAQIFLSAQFVYEEKMLSSYDIEPLQAVGWEGFYGLIIMSIVLVPLSYINTGSCLWSNSPSSPWTLEDPIDGFIQLRNNYLLLGLFCGYVMLVPFYVYSHIAVTKEFSATTTIVLESSRAILVWMISLYVGWQDFQYLQLIGFVISTIGIFLYNYEWK